MIRNNVLDAPVWNDLTSVHVVSSMKALDILLNRILLRMTERSGLLPVYNATTVNNMGRKLFMVVWLCVDGCGENIGISIF